MFFYPFATFSFVAFIIVECDEWGIWIWYFASAILRYAFNASIHSIHYLYSNFWINNFIQRISEWTDKNCFGEKKIESIPSLCFPPSMRRYMYLCEMWIRLQGITQLIAPIWGSQNLTHSLTHTHPPFCFAVCENPRSQLLRQRTT